MSHAPRSLVHRSAQGASRLQAKDEVAARLGEEEEEDVLQPEEEDDAEQPGGAEAEAEGAEQNNEDGGAPAPPGGIVAAGAADADDDEELLCVICMHECFPDDEIYSCATCSLVVHLRCMRSWLQESEAKQRMGKCPGCQLPLGCLSYELSYRCWCHRINWHNEQPPGLIASHSCGMECGRQRGQGCAHPCAAICHRGRCKPCGNMREGVRCVGDHRTYAPFACGSEPAERCTQACGKPLACGHSCASPCHAPDVPHAACMVLVPKSCACGKAQADSDSAVRVPCSQVVVQCDALCGRMQQCGLHVCERQCHAGQCAELLVSSAWNKAAWVKVGPSAAAVPSAARNNVNSAAGSNSDFPALGGASAAAAASSLPRAAAPAPSSSSSTSVASSSFRSCGKACNRRRSCGHACTQTCHALSSAATPATASDERKEDVEARASASSASSAVSSAACDAKPCTQLIALSCPCGRKSEKVRCCDRDTRSSLQCVRCDHVCAVHLRGREFERELHSVAPAEDPSVLGELKTLLPYPAHLLALLCGGGPASSAGGNGGSSAVAPGSLPSAHAVATEAQFLRKTEQAVREFCVRLATTLDREEAGATCPPTPSANISSAQSRQARNNVAASSSASAPPSVRHLFLSGLTPSRRHLVSQLALAHSLHFDAESGGLSELAGAGAERKKALLLQQQQQSQSASATPSGQRDSGEQKESLASSAGPALAIDSASVVEDPLSSAGLHIAAPYTSFFLPSLSLTQASDLYRQSGHLSSCATADSWPSSLRVKLHFEAGAGEAATEADDPTTLVQRWIAPVAGACRACWITPRTLVLLFGSALRARECYSLLLRAHSAELSGARTQVEAPAPSKAPAVRALVAREESALQAIRRAEAAARLQHAEEYAALQQREAAHRAAHPAPGASVLPQAPRAAKHAVAAVRSNMVGHHKVQVKASNMWAALGSDDDE